MDSTNWRGDFEKALEGEGAKGERQAQVWTVLSPVTAARVTVPVMVPTFIHPAAGAARCVTRRRRAVSVELRRALARDVADVHVEPCGRQLRRRRTNGASRMTGAASSGEPSRITIQP